MLKRELFLEYKQLKKKQDTQIIYYYGQELSNYQMTIEEYKEKVMKVSKEDILAVANKVSINTVYFLKN